MFYAGKNVPYCRTDDTLARFLEDTDEPYVLTTADHERELHDRFPGRFTVLMRRPRFLHSGEVVVLAERSQQPATSTAHETGLGHDDTTRR